MKYVKVIFYILLRYSFYKTLFKFFLNYQATFHSLKFVLYKYIIINIFTVLKFFHTTEHKIPNTEVRVKNPNYMLNIYTW